jgi:hypothetical protein
MPSFADFVVKSSALIFHPQRSAPIHFGHLRKTRPVPVLCFRDEALKDAQLSLYARLHDDHHPPLSMKVIIQFVKRNFSKSPGSDWSPSPPN